MKPNHLIVYIVLSFCTTFSYSQNFPFPTNNSTWINVGRTFTLNQWNLPIWQTNWIDRYCMDGTDTLINTTTYKRIDLCTVSNSYYHGAIRYDTGTVYFVPKDSLNEYLLYDFTVSVGDTVNVIQNTCDGSSSCAINPNYDFMNIPILDIDTIIVNGTERRRINGQSAFSNQWIEGIGSTAGLFMYFEDNISNYDYGLRCASVNDTTVYDYSPLEIGTSGSCNLSLDVSEVENNSYLKIYPNPVNTTSFSVDGLGASDYVDINIFNSNGKRVKTVNNLSSDFNTIQVKDLESGIYYVHFLSEKFHRVQKLIITE